MGAPDWNSLSPTPPAPEEASGPQPSAPLAPSPAADWDSMSKTPPPNADGSPSDWDSLQGSEDFHTSPFQKVIAAEESLERGLSGGASDVFRTQIEPMFLPKSLQSDPKEMKARQEDNPIESFGGNLVGTGALLATAGAAGLLPEATSFAGKVGMNAALGSLLAGSGSVSNDLAFGDPNATAAKILSNAELPIFFGGLLGGGTTAILEGAVAGAKGFSNLVEKIKNSPPESLTLSHDAIGPLDKIRLGLFQGLNSDPASEKAVAEKVARGMNSLKDVSSMEDLSALSDGTSPETIQRFGEHRESFLKDFGDPKTGEIDPEEILSHLTGPDSKAAAKKTVSFNNYLKSIEDVSKLKFQDENVGRALSEAQGNLQDWMSELVAGNETLPRVDIEYGGPAHLEGSGLSDPGEPQPYSTDVDSYELDKKTGASVLESGMAKRKPLTPNFQEGVTLNSGENTARVPTYGNERVSPFEETSGPSLARIQQKIKEYQEQVLSLLDQQSEGPKISSADVSSSLEESKAGLKSVSNLSKTKEAIHDPSHHVNPLAAFALSKIPVFGKPLATLYAGIRRWGGDGGLYRLGNDIASPAKILEGVASHIKASDEKISQAARLIFTGSSNQIRKGEENE